MADKAERKGRTAATAKADKGEKPAKGKAEATPSIPRVPARLRQRFRSEIAPALMRQFNYTNRMQVPEIRKVVVNMGLGEAAITGQRPVVTRAKKSEASFKLRAGMPIGCKVTLRGERMYEFVDRLLSIALPRIRDFRGVPAKSFDGRGNYSLGLREQLIFPEVRYDKVEATRGMDICIETSARTDEEARSLLEHLGFPFRKVEK
jgi:large subunit ribosomal protein L5